MGSLNMAEISVDAHSGFMTIHSRHKLDVNQSKIIGAVAILLVEPTNTSDSSTAAGVNPASTFTRNAHKDDVIDIDDPCSGGTGRATLIVPSSVSLISSPCGWMGNERLAKVATGHNFENNSHSTSPEHRLRNTAHANQASSLNNTKETIHERNVDQESVQYLYSSSDKSRQRPYDQSKSKQTDYKSPSGEDMPTRNVSVIDLTDLAGRQPQNKQDAQPTVTAPSGNTYRRQGSSNTFLRPVREPRASSQTKVTQLVHAPRVSSPFLSRVNFHLQRRKYRNTKISKLVQQPPSQRANDAKCCACGDVLTSFADNQSHSTKHNLPNQCVVCGITLPATSNLRRHFLGHIHNIAFTCPFCPAMYRRKDNLTSHLFQKHNINSMQRRAQQLLTRLGKVPKPIQEIEGTHQTPASHHDLHGSQGFIEVPGDSTSDSGNTSVIPVLSTSSNDSTENTMHPPMETDVPSDIPQVVSRIPDPNSDSEVCHPLVQPNDSPIQIKEEPEGYFDGQDVHQTNTIPGNQQTEGDTTDPVALYSAGGTQASNDVPTTEGVNPLSSNSILNYSCSTCDVKFPQLEKLQHHVSAFHSDEMSTEMAGSGIHTSMSNENIHVTTADPIVANDSVEGQALYLYNDSHGSGLDDETIRMALGSRSTQLEEVIDIENLSDMRSFQHTESTPIQQAGYSGTRSGDILSKATEFLGNIYPSYFPPSYESSPSNSLNKSFDMDASNTGFTGRKKISKGNNKCLICGMLLTSWEAIMEHGDQHNNVLPTDYGTGKRFPCVVCQTVLSTRDSLRRHAVNHMGVQHFCTMCSAVYSRRDNLLKHMRDTHGIQPPRA
ncbi:uncharacterized protein LOC110445633 [Mizuhopecten yessoensis]|uniref:Zinc finger protein PLAGL1 n=1 Tax=Mizuhopecten yessoensis TaxID=6573 RepID=A0A210QZF2_MIZYE|nr:uncharacterized protein LOC110445633 [Mizuhopecten yessoensis]OWF54045.1 Zinc finger protein PLAGL1 [Mizuhopecten yessoensis]